MNAVFTLLFLLSAVLLLKAPERFLPALLDGASKSAAVCVGILASYAAWLGLMRLWEECGVAKKFSRGLRPICRRLFKTEDDEALSAIGMNLSANLLGIGSAATPYGIKAANLLERADPSGYASSMLFVVNATSLQLIPVSVVSMRVSLGSAAPADIILPTVLCTVFSTLLGVLLVRVCLRPRAKRAKTGAKTKAKATASAAASAKTKAEAGA